MGFVIGSGTVAVKVVCWFEIVIGTELGGVTVLRMFPPVLSIALDVASPRLLMGIDVVKVLSDLETVTGTNKPDPTLEITPPGLVIGTLVVKVLSE